MSLEYAWKELVYDNSVFRLALTKLIKDDCLQTISSSSWEEILRLLVEHYDDPFACFARSRYYFDVANSVSTNDGKAYIKKALKETEHCIEVLDIKASIQPGMSLAYDFYGLVHLPFCVVLFQAGSLCGLDGKKANRAIEYFLLYQRCQRIVSPGEYYSSLLSFRNYSEFVLSDLIKRELTVMPPRVMNDCLDSLFFPWIHCHEESLNDRIKKESDIAKKNNLIKYLNVLKLFSKSMSYYRIRSFVEPKRDDHDNIQNPLMWAHYANEHKGIAILYSFKNSEASHVDRNRIWKFRAIQYAKKNEIIDVSKDTISIDKAFLTKSNEWSYEDEIRLLSYNNSVKSDYDQIPIGTIEAVYFGIRCPDQTINTIQTLLKQYPYKIDYYKMKIDETNVYKLKAVKI